MTDKPVDEEITATALPDASSAVSGQLVSAMKTPPRGPTQELIEASVLMGLVHPDQLPPGELQLAVRRTFCFVDLSGFTAFTREHGPHEAVTLLVEFRRLLRNVAAKRGVRLAKWLGDGAMLVAMQPDPIVGLGAHLIDRYFNEQIQLRVGAATGEALLFEGDDYIGEPVNLAAKLCSAAKGGQMLTVVDDFLLPSWISHVGKVTVEIRGIGRIGGVNLLMPSRLV